MHIIDKDGQLREGFPLTEEQIKQRKQILDYVHQAVCGGDTHASWDIKYYGMPKCEALANFFVTSYTLTPLPNTDIEARTAELENENCPKATEPLTPDISHDAEI